MTAVEAIGELLRKRRPAKSNTWVEDLLEVVCNLLAQILDRLPPKRDNSSQVE